eukprot:gene11481-34197_t
MERVGGPSYPPLKSYQNASQKASDVPEHVICSHSGSCHNEDHIRPTTMRQMYPMLQSFFKEEYPTLLMKHGKPISEADLDLLCGKESTLAVCHFDKREVLKVVNNGALAIECHIMLAREVNYAVPTPLFKDNDDHFVLKLEVDDPDDPVNNPSLFFIIPKDPDGFFGAPGVDGKEECERWMSKLSGHVYEHVWPTVQIRPYCCRAALPGPYGRHSRAIDEDHAARRGICFTCSKDTCQVQADQLEQRHTKPGYYLMRAIPLHALHSILSMQLARFKLTSWNKGTPSQAGQVQADQLEQRHTKPGYYLMRAISLHALHSILSMQLARFKLTSWNKGTPSQGTT